MPVYFIGCANGPVKIGFASDMEQRLAGIQTGNPRLLRIQAAAPGDRELEREYHRRFKAHRLQGEWLTRCPEIIAEMRRLRDAHRDEFGFL